MAVGDGGNEFTYSNGTWSSGQQLDPGVNGDFDISCPTDTFCVMVDEGDHEFTYSAGTWSSGRQIDQEGSLTSVSCPTTTFCVAVDNSGMVFIYSAGTWSNGGQIDLEGGPQINGDDALTSVSCPTTRFCVALGALGYVFTYSGGAWSSGQQIDVEGDPQINGYKTLTSVSCPTTTFCVAVDEGGYGFTYSAGTWSSGQQVDRGNQSDGGDLVSVSCPTTTFCVAVDDETGYEFTYSGGVWSRGQQIDDTNSAALVSVSCPTTTFCVAVDNNGYVLTYSTPLVITTPAPPPSNIPSQIPWSSYGISMTSRQRPWEDARQTFVVALEAFEEHAGAYLTSPERGFYAFVSEDKTQPGWYEFVVLATLAASRGPHGGAQGFGVAKLSSAGWNITAGPSQQAICPSDPDNYGTPTSVLTDFAIDAGCPQ
jgi:hypothetical protein